MVTTIISEYEKVITADDGKMLTNGGSFVEHPLQLTVNINDNSWYEITLIENMV